MQGIQGAVSSSGEVEQGKIPEKYIFDVQRAFLHPMKCHKKYDNQSTSQVGRNS